MIKAWSINKKLAVSYSLLILLVVLSILVVLSLILSGRLMRRAQGQLDQKLGDITAAIQGQLMDVIAVCDDVKEDARIIRALNATGPGERPDKNAVPALIQERYAASDTLIGKLILIDRNLEILDPVYDRVLYRDAILTDEDFTEFLEKRYGFYFSTPGIFPIDPEPSSPEEDRLTIVLYQRLLDERYWLMGYLLSIIRKDLLFSPLHEIDPEDLFTWIGVFNSERRLVFTRGEGPAPESVLAALPGGLNRTSGIGPPALRERPPFVTAIEAQRTLVAVRQIPRVNWFVVGLTPYRRAMSDLRLAIRLILAIGAGFLLAGIALSAFIARTITHPLEEITRTMHAYDENRALAKIDLQASGELAYLVRVYNRLVDSINESIRNIYAEQEKKKEAELRSLEYELDFLQAQINPHFIYNTLNAIGFQAEKAGNDAVYDSLKSFNILLKAAVSGIGELVTLRQELSLVDNFIRIQRLRYGDTFDMIREIPPTLLDARVPKLILQPVVENAVFHGIEPSGRPGTITIRARRSDGGLVLEVADNGVGMPVGMQADLAAAATLQNDDRRRFNRIGLANVGERIKILFGAGYGLSLESRQGEGTTVTITLPDGQGAVE